MGKFKSFARGLGLFLVVILGVAVWLASPWFVLLAESAEHAAYASIELADQIAGLQARWREQAGRPGSAVEQPTTGIVVHRAS